MDLEIFTLNEVRQISYDIAYMCNAYKRVQMNLQNLGRVTNVESKLMFTSG